MSRCVNQQGTEKWFVRKCLRQKAEKYFQGIKSMSVEKKFQPDDQPISLTMNEGSCLTFRKKRMRQWNIYCIENEENNR